MLDWIGFPDWNLSAVESIAVDPLDSQRVYLAVRTYTNEWATENGAILRSFNQGRTLVFAEDDSGYEATTTADVDVLEAVGVETEGQHLS